MFLTKVSALIVSSAIFSLPVNAIAQTTSRTSASNAEASRLTTEYTALAGSQQNASSLIEGLRNGTQVTLTSSGGTTTVFTPPTGKMGYGEVNISLALAEKLMSSNPNLTLSGALMGSGSTQGILQMRASGMGWGQIANSLGFRLGDVMRSAKADSSAHNEQLRAERAERPANIDRPERPERPERSSR